MYNQSFTALLRRPRVSRSPIHILRALIWGARLCTYGLISLVGVITVYLFGFMLIVCALLKPFHPHSAGVWVLPDRTLSIRLGFSGAPPGGSDLFGWWIIPVGLGLGGGLLIATWQFALWCARQYRRLRA